MPIPIIEAFRELSGNTPRQKTERFFTSPETSADLESLVKIDPTSDDQVQQGHQIVKGLIVRGLKSGVPPDIMEKSLPLLAHVHSSDPRTEIKALMGGMRDKYTSTATNLPADTTVPDDVAAGNDLAYGGPGRSGDFTLKKPGADPANFPDVEDIGSLIRAHIAGGGKGLPPNLQGIMRVPGQKTYDAARTGAQNALVPLREAQTRSTNSLADIRDAEGEAAAEAGDQTPDEEPTALQRFFKPALRGKQETPLDQQVKQSQVNRNNAAAEAARTRKTATGSALFKEYVQFGGDPEDPDAYLEYVARKSKAARRPTATETLLGDENGAPGGTPASKPPSRASGAPTAESVKRKFNLK